MSGFDFSDIERVNRIELQPNELVLFHTHRLISAADADGFKEHFNGTPLEGKVIFLSGDWKVATVTAPPPDPRHPES